MAPVFLFFANQIHNSSERRRRLFPVTAGASHGSLGTGRVTGVADRLEPEDQSGGGLGGVGCRARVQCVQSKVGPFVYEATVFGAKYEVLA